MERVTRWGDWENDFFSSRWAEMIYFGVEKQTIQIIPWLCVRKWGATAFTRGWDAARLLQPGQTTAVVLLLRAECATILHCAVRCLWLMRMDRRRRRRKSSRRRRKMYHCRPGMQGTWEACRNCFFLFSFLQNFSLLTSFWCFWKWQPNKQEPV